MVEEYNLNEELILCLGTCLQQYEAEGKWVYEQHP